MRAQLSAHSRNIASSSLPGFSSTVFVRFIGINNYLCFYLYIQDIDMKELNYASSVSTSIPAFIPALNGGAFCAMCGKKFC